MDFSPIETEGLVVESEGSGFQLTPIILDSMLPDEVLVEMKYSGICHTVGSHPPPRVLCSSRAHPIIGMHRTSELREADIAL